MTPLLWLGLILGLLSLSGCVVPPHVAISRAANEAMADFHPPARMDEDCKDFELNIYEEAHKVRGFSLEGFVDHDGCFPCGLLMVGGYEFIEARRINDSNLSVKYTRQPGLYRYTLVPRTVENEATCKRFDYANAQGAHIILKDADRFYGMPISGASFVLEKAHRAGRLVGAAYLERAKNFCITATPISEFQAPYHIKRFSTFFMNADMEDNKGSYRRKSTVFYRQPGNIVMAERAEVYTYRLWPKHGRALTRSCWRKNDLNIPAVLMPINEKRFMKTRSIIQSVWGAE